MNSGNDTVILTGFLVIVLCAIAAVCIVGYKAESAKEAMVISCKGDIACIKEVTKDCGELK